MVTARNLLSQPPEDQNTARSLTRHDFLGAGRYDELEELNRVKEELNQMMNDVRREMKKLDDIMAAHPNGLPDSPMETINKAVGREDRSDDRGETRANRLKFEHLEKEPEDGQVHPDGTIRKEKP
jgi:hypothetical protein